ncbi:Na+/H+ antiporter NhaC family protein [Aliikangiella coralliicola]|uniref:Sodium:proton antiporter n=1 Tax=Aliikangiella coralliicola TaxID=2592383 RepID=A0A545UFW2_9GAMM|nr:Na+/H+ antiporter NhaC family protein [Aliikangiella coralliicola]TQV88364.1 sodium:proton antiporter [Aliikangiella coralliicola]
MDWLTLLPPTVAIVVAVWKKDVIISLLAALFVAESLLVSFNLATGFLGVFDRIVDVFSSAGNTRILIFSLLIGALLSLIKHSGGVAAFVNWVSHRGLASNKRQVSALPTLLGIVIFIETNLSILTAGFISRDLFDKLKMSRARLAYIIDSTCAPICVIILFNAWGAYILSLLSGYELDNAVESLVYSIPYNLYSWLTLFLVFYTVWSGRVFGPMQQSEQNLANIQVEQEKTPDATSTSFMIVPLLVMIGGILFFMWYTGEGKILEGSGSQSVLWAVGLACLTAFIMLRFSSQKQPAGDLVKWSFKGMSDLLPLVTTVLLALALGNSMKALGTGEFVSQMVTENLPLWTVPALIFISAAIISFTTGTSWGTFGILIPIGVPIALSSGIPVEVVLAAVMGGGVFGDHCSPISDTTIVSSLAAGCDHLEHVKTQLPYALLAGGLSVVGFLVVGVSI